MAGLVVPHRGSDGNTRLAEAGDRESLTVAMLADVLSACLAVGPTTVVTSDDVAAAVAQELGAEIVADPGRGQGPAVAAALSHPPGVPVLVINSDLPAATPRDLLSLLGAMPAGGIAIAEAEDGTTNALALAAPHLFDDLYGEHSA